LAECSFFKKLDSIDLSENKIGTHGIKSLPSLNFLSQIKTMNLAKNDIGVSIENIYEKNYSFLKFWWTISISIFLIFLGFIF